MNLNHRRLSAVPSSIPAIKYSMKHRRASGQAPLALAPLLALLLLAPPGCSAYCPTDAYIEALGDLLADKTLLVEECHRQLLGLKQDMDNLPETPAHLPACAVADDAAKVRAQAMVPAACWRWSVARRLLVEPFLLQVRTELESANAELAAAEELLEVAQVCALPCSSLNWMRTPALTKRVAPCRACAPPADAARGG